jgi:hypothetical protein
MHTITSRYSHDYDDVTEELHMYYIQHGPIIEYWKTVIVRSYQLSELPREHHIQTWSVIVSLAAANCRRASSLTIPFLAGPPPLHLYPGQGRWLIKRDTDILLCLIEPSGLISRVMEQ